MDDFATEKVRIVPIVWDETAEIHLAKIDNPTPVSWYQNEVYCGRLAVFGIFYDGHRRATVCTRNEGGEFVIVAAAGRADFDLTSKILPLFEIIAHFNNCQTMRLHTARPGLVKKAEKMDWNFQEFVMRKELKNGR